MTIDNLITSTESKAKGNTFAIIELTDRFIMGEISKELFESEVLKLESND